MKGKSFRVPAEMSEEADVFVKLVKETAKSKGLEDDIYVLRPKTKGFGMAELSDVVIHWGGATAVWLTKKWIDTYLWPLVESRLDVPSKKFLNWLKDRLSNVSEQTHHLDVKQ